jgi:hypothetical protein
VSLEVEERVRDDYDYEHCNSKEFNKVDRDVEQNDCQEVK